MQTLQILHLEDDPLDAELMINTLEGAGIDCEVIRVDTEIDFRAALSQRRFDIIVSDFSMPGFDGKSALKIAQHKSPEVPFIFVSGTIGEDAAIDSLLGGATDYVLKHRFTRLVPAIQRAGREAEERKERRRSEEKLRESEIRYRQLFESNPHAMWVYDVQTLRFLAVNDSAIERYGYSREEFLRMTIEEIHHGDTAAVSFQDNPQPRSPRSWRHRKKDGKIIDVEIASHELPFGGRTARLVSADDVTERKLIESQLLRAQRMDSIGTLAAGIAHDLNNVLAPILMAVQLMQERFRDDSSQRLLKTLETSARRGSGIVRQVLTFARGVEGEYAPLQPRHLLSGMEQMLNQTFPKSIRIEAEFSSKLWTILGDPTQLDQVLLNLCVNARDAMPDGGVLKISAENTILDEHYVRLNLDAKPGPFVVFEVADTGHGIPKDIIDKIFDPFFTTKEVGKGTGLGLSTTIAIVRGHGGFVNVYSEPGNGTSFKVFLPAKESEHTADTQLNRGSLPRGNGELVLIVDDEIAVREIAQITLEEYGYRVVTANNGVEAIACYTRLGGEIKTVLLDMMMPIMDGPTAIHALREVDPDVRIIAASGLVESAKKAGASHVAGAAVRAILSKPYSAEKLLTVMHEVISAST